jgi:hypothetical protein
MTQVVVTDLGKTVVANIQTTQVITSGMMPPNIVGTITNSADVDVSGLQDGGMLVYSTATNKWVATNLLDKQIFEAGQF